MIVNSVFPTVTAMMTTMPIVKRILRIVIVVEMLLLLGFLPTLFHPSARIYGGPGGGWDWSLWTFVSPMAGLMFLTGLGIDTAVRKIKNPVYRAIVIALLLLAFSCIWSTAVRSE